MFGLFKQAANLPVRVGELRSMLMGYECGSASPSAGTVWSSQACVYEQHPRDTDIPVYPKKIAIYAIASK
jgi:hypothetical protein